MSTGTMTAGRMQHKRPSRLLSNLPPLIGGLILLLIVVGAIFAPLLAPFDPGEQNLRSVLQPPSWAPGSDSNHFMGTDALGRDIWSRMIYGARTSLIVGVAAVLIQGTIGVALGLFSGYYGGSADSVIMRLADVQLAIPFLVLSMAVAAVVGTGLYSLIFILGIVGWVVYARVVRAEVLDLREKEFVQAARALGARDKRIIMKHVLPNVVASVAVIATLQIAQMIIAESALSFLGLGIQPPLFSWGHMVAEGRAFLATHWWIATCPGGAIFFTVLALNLVGDWLRDRMDPTLQI